MRAASMIWERLGPGVDSYIEPFAGSLAVLLQRPGGAGQTETVNDADGFICNFWRALAADPDGVAAAADWPVSELDLTARHLWLVGRRADLTARLEADPDYHDAKVAGWWVWGICSWIGSGWCDGRGPWRVSEDGARVVKGGGGVNRKLPHLGDDGRGVNRQLPHLGNDGRGVNRQEATAEWLRDLSARLRRVRVCCGDWRRVCTPSASNRNAATVAYLLDPPYDDGFDPDGCYAAGVGSLWGDVARWAAEAGEDPRHRIALCGYEGAWEVAGLRVPRGWDEVAWRTKGGYGGGMGGDGEDNQRRERVWFSPACIGSRQIGLFG